MDLQELKNTIAVIERAESNIEHWNKLRNRELVVIPVDSEYYKEFKIWKNQKGACYNGEKECSPIYINASKAGGVLDLMIKHQEEFAKPHKEKIHFLLDVKEILKRPEFPSDRI